MKLLFSLLLSFSVLQITAQSLSVNTDGSSANTSAILDVKSTAKGMLVPRMNSVQRTGIGTPATGLLVYDTDSLSFSYYNGAAWAFIKSGADAGKDWSTRGNAGTTSANFIGTTDAQDLYFKLANSNAGYLKINGNTGFGYGAATLTTGLSNTAVGANALSANTSGTNNIGLGNNALKISAANSDNMAIGVDAMSKITANSFGNIAIGNNSMINSPKAYDNVAIGQNSLTRINNITSGYGYDNVAIGSEALRYDSAGINNTMVGSKAGRGVTYSSFGNSSNNNTAIGAYAMYYNKFANNNVALGASALYTDSLGNFNIGVGTKALYLNRSGSENISLGYKSQYGNLSADKNIAIGTGVLADNQTGDENVAIGDSAMNKTFGIGSSGSVAIGSKALKNNIFGYSNVAIGNNAMSEGGSTDLNFMARNVAIGYDALRKLGTLGGMNYADDNTAVGNAALSKNTYGYSNTAIGSLALWNSNIGYKNTTVGENSLGNTTDGNNNTAIGEEAGLTNTTGNNNTYMGYLANAASTNLNNAAAIGSNAYVSQSNSIVLGSINGTNAATADTKVGIGVTAPSEKLEIGNGRLRFKGNLASSNAHGITWTDNAGTTDKTFIGIETDNFWGVYNYGLGAWNIRVHNTSGEMGINKQPGTTTAESRLQVKQASSGATRAIGIETAINTNRWDIWVDNNAGPDFNFNYNGAIRSYIQNATGNYIVSSDRRLKKDIQPAAPALANLLQIPVYTFKYIGNSYADPISIGFMAQDVQRFYPNATPVKTDEKGEEKLGLNYQAITALSVKAIQEQQQIIENQNKKIDNLQTQIDELKKLIKKD